MRSSNLTQLSSPWRKEPDGAISVQGHILKYFFIYIFMLSNSVGNIEGAGPIPPQPNPFVQLSVITIVNYIAGSPQFPLVAVMSHPSHFLDWYSLPEPCRHSFLKAPRRPSLPNFWLCYLWFSDHVQFTKQDSPSFSFDTNMRPSWLPPPCSPPFPSVPLTLLAGTVPPWYLAAAPKVLLIDGPLPTLLCSLNCLSL